MGAKEEWENPPAGPAFDAMEPEEREAVLASWEKAKRAALPSDEVLAKALTLVRTARFQVEYAWPYFSELATSLTLVETTKVPTMAVDAFWRMYYNPAWVASHDTGEIFGVVAHEMMHLWSKHHERFEHMPVAKSYSMSRVWNVAADAALNTTLAKALADIQEFQVKMAYPRLPSSAYLWYMIPASARNHLAEHHLGSYNKNEALAKGAADFTGPTMAAQVFAAMGPEVFLVTLTNASDVATATLNGTAVQLMDAPMPPEDNKTFYVANLTGQLSGDQDVLAVKLTTGEVLTTYVFSAAPRLILDNEWVNNPNVKQGFVNTLRLALSGAEIVAETGAALRIVSATGQTVLSATMGDGVFNRLTSVSYTVTTPDVLTDGEYSIEVTLEDGTVVSTQLSIGSSAMRVLQGSLSMSTQDGYVLPGWVTEVSPGDVRSAKLMVSDLHGNWSDTGLMKLVRLADEHNGVDVFNLVLDTQGAGLAPAAYRVDVALRSGILSQVMPIAAPGAGQGDGEGEGDDQPGEDHGSGAGGPARDWEQGGSDQEDGEGTGVSEARQERILQRCAEKLVKAAEQGGSGIGNVPGEWVRQANTFLKPIVSWRRETASLARVVQSLRSGGEDYTFSKPNIRRQHMASGGIILPSLTDADPSVVDLVADTSGSVSNQELCQVFTESGSLLRDLSSGDCGLRFRACDTSVSESRIIRSVNDIKFTGGGGTDMRVAFEAIAKERKKPSMVIVATDGETPWPESKPKGNHKCRYIALIINSNRRICEKVPSWIHVVYIDRADLQKI